MNFIASKPTSTFKAGFDATAARFEKDDISAFISGPLAETLKARFAIRSVQGGTWQYDYTRTDAHTGRSNLNEARLLLEWRPNDRATMLLNVNGYIDYDGTTFQVVDVRTPSWISTIIQELRYSYQGSSASWVVGGSFESDRTFDENVLDLSQSSVNHVGPYPLTQAEYHNDQDSNSYAGFGNVEFALAQHLSAQAGARFTQTDRSFSGCSADSGNGQLVAIEEFLITSFSGMPRSHPISPGCCTTLNSNFVPGLFNASLDQNNVSWRAGINWKPAGRSPIYGNVSRGINPAVFRPKQRFLTALITPFPKNLSSPMRSELKPPLLIKCSMFLRHFFTTTTGTNSFKASYMSNPLVLMTR